MLIKAFNVMHRTPWAKNLLGEEDFDFLPIVKVRLISKCRTRMRKDTKAIRHLKVGFAK